MKSLPPFITLWNSFEASSTPWKNGGGKTKEIAIFPSASSVAENNFLWRLSEAEIQQDGEFSSFPGIDRFLSLLEGARLELQHGPHRSSLATGDIASFSGDELTKASLPAGPVQELGLIFRRGLVQAKMKEIPFLGKARSFSLNAKTNFFIAAAGRFQLSIYLDRAKRKT